MDDGKTSILIAFNYKCGYKKDAPKNRTDLMCEFFEPAREMRRECGHLTESKMCAHARLNPISLVNECACEAARKHALEHLKRSYKNDKTNS